MSVPRVPPLPPKLPPWGWLDHAHLVGGQPKVAARPSPKWVADWTLPRRVRLCSHGIPLADHAEGLERVGAQPVPAELLGEDVVASAKAASTSPQVKTRWSMTLVPFSSMTSGLSGSIAFVASATTSSGLVVDLDQLEGVLGDVAAHRRDGGHRLAHEADLVGGEAVGAPASGRGAGLLQRSASSPVTTATTPGSFSASLVSIDVDARVGQGDCAGSRSAACRAALHVVDELRAAGDQARDPPRASRPAHPSAARCREDLPGDLGISTAILSLSPSLCRSPSVFACARPVLGGAGVRWGISAELGGRQPAGAQDRSGSRCSGRSGRRARP